jgi:hypothetical protein
MDVGNEADWDSVRQVIFYNSNISLFCHDKPDILSQYCPLVSIIITDPDISISFGFHTLQEHELDIFWIQTI